MLRPAAQRARGVFPPGRGVRRPIRRHRQRRHDSRLQAPQDRLQRAGAPVYGQEHPLRQGRLHQCGQRRAGLPPYPGHLQAGCTCGERGRRLARERADLPGARHRICRAAACALHRAGGALIDGVEAGGEPGADPSGPCRHLD